VADLLYLRLLPKLLRCRDFRPRARNGPEHLQRMVTRWPRQCAL